MTVFVRLSCLLLIGIVLAGCSPLGTSSDESGRKAPEITGLDGEGRAMHLSEFHGKVILLDFWFSACGPCRNFESQEKAVLKRYEGRPFVVLGVNADPTRALLSETQQTDRLPWRSWWDGQGGPIATQWRVHVFPTVILIDHLGRLRERWDGPPTPAELEAKLDKLVIEAEKPTPAGGN